MRHAELLSGMVMHACNGILGKGEGKLGDETCRAVIRHGHACITAKMLGLF